MEMRVKLAIIWIAIGLFEILSAHLFVARKRDPFANPNSRLAAKWLKPIKNLQTTAKAAMGAGILSREWLVGLTVRLMTQMGLALMLLGGLLLVHPWSSTVALAISVVGIVALMAVFITAFTLKGIRISKSG